MRHRGDARAVHQLDQQLIGAQVERDDAAWWPLTCKRTGRPQERNGRQPDTGPRPPRYTVAVCYFTHAVPMPSVPPNVSLRPA